MTENNSVEIPKNVVLYIIGGVVVVGLAYICSPFIKEKLSVQQRIEQTKTEDKRLPAAGGVSGAINSFWETVAAYTYASPDVLSELRYGVKEADREAYFEYESLEKAIAKLKVLKSNNKAALKNKLQEDPNSKDLESDLVLRIGFPDRLILDHNKTKGELLAWLARLNDYVFAKRFSLFEATDVISSVDFNRVEANQITTRGNILYSEKDNLWWVEIRGLKNSVKNIKTVADYLKRALRAPKDMSTCASFATEPFSSKIRRYRLNDLSNVLSDQHAELVDIFVEYCNNEKGSKKFLLESDFTKAENILDLQREILIKETNNSLNNFNANVLPMLIKYHTAEDEPRREARDKYYLYFALAMKEWVEKTQLPTILEQSLFIIR